MYQQFGIRCPTCGDEVYSNSRHDWESCLCGSVFIDGGWDYQRVGYDAGVMPEKISRMVEKAGIYYYSEEPDRQAQLRAASKGR